MKIPLSAWAARHYAPAPSIRTLRTWVARRQILPMPEKVGRTWMVEEHAQRVTLAYELPPANDDGATLSPRALAILHAAA